MKTILHPTDFSELSKKILQLAQTRAEVVGGRLILLHIRQPQEVIEGEFGMPPPEPEPSDEQLLADLESLVPPNCAASVEVILSRGTIADEIVRIAKERQCDLIMMASHGHDGFFSRLFHTNVAEQVKQQAPCPVMAITEADVREPAIL
jgi:nucleotide-binding universal stress UspA family protein